MNYKTIDFENWDRKENFIYFTENKPCKINMTANIDITDIIQEAKNKALRCYPLFAYMIAKIINDHDEFKISIDENKNIIVWDTVNVRYPIFHEEDKIISILWSEYLEDFSEFYNNFINDCKSYGEIRSMAAKGKYPENCFDITSIPWVSFTSFSCPADDGGKLFLPFVAIGKFFKQGANILLPVSIIVLHAVCASSTISTILSKVSFLTPVSLLNFSLSISSIISYFNQFGKRSIVRTGLGSDETPGQKYFSECTELSTERRADIENGLHRARAFYQALQELSNEDSEHKDLYQELINKIMKEVPEQDGISLVKSS